jgi:hypothetical protein
MLIDCLVMLLIEIIDRALTSKNKTLLTENNDRFVTQNILSESID